MTKIETLDALMLAASNRRSVIVPGSGGWESPRPAAVTTTRTEDTPAR